MSFVKRGGSDGKIMNVLDENDLTDEQKKAVKKMSEQFVKQSELSDSIDTKRSEN